MAGYNRRYFERIQAEGTGKTFTLEANRVWDATTRPLVEAFFHARFFLEMAIKYSEELNEPPSMLPSGSLSDAKQFGAARGGRRGASARRLELGGATAWKRSNPAPTC